MDAHLLATATRTAWNNTLQSFPRWMHTCGWLLTTETMRMMLLGMDKTLPGLKNFYLAGQWVEPGGSLPLSAMSGRNAIQLICHADGCPFVTSTPPHPD